ncbi:glycosyltransferase family 2 protein [Lutibacter sp.]|uniref:glycosyltransferase family A protein n=1 Tax=Lutibacter sp. TaxID=1925666 RepID=UPI001A2254A3|nr:glycosyltransferase family 2 protein [Lutibacter sp.]MBI9042251.1 glycosyltransferase family 2 protein [Lutibacter sp.]
MLVSIIIPVHKLHPFFKECIASVLAQTHNNIEVLVVCNGELKIEECKKYLNSSDNRLLFFKSIEGRHNARNRGFEEAKGAYIQFLDYDDILYATKIEKQLHQFSFNANCTICICKWKKFHKNISEYYILPFEGIFNETILNSQKLYEMLGTFGGFIATASWLIDASSIGNIKWMDVPNDDAVFLSELLVQQPSILMLPEVLAGYRIHSQNESARRTKEEFDKLLEGWKVIEKNVKIFENNYTLQYLLNAHIYLFSYSRQIKNYKLVKVVSNILRLFIKRNILNLTN